MNGKPDDEKTPDHQDSAAEILKTPEAREVGALRRKQIEKGESDLSDVIAEAASNAAPDDDGS